MTAVPAIADTFIYAVNANGECFVSETSIYAGTNQYIIGDETVTVEAIPAQVVT